MSTFDSVATKIWSAAKSVHGDSAVYRYLSDAADVSITVLCNLDAQEDGQDFEFRSAVRTIEIAVGDVSRPIRGDQIEVTSGQHAGRYTVTGVADEDEYSYRVAVA